jgi:hypothetical protein
MTDQCLGGIAIKDQSLVPENRVLFTIEAECAAQSWKLTPFLFEYRGL